MWVWKRARSDRGQRGRRNDLLKFAVIDFPAFKPSKPAKSISLSSGKTQLSSGLLELSGSGKAPSEQSFVKPSPDAVKLVNDETFSPRRRDEITTLHCLARPTKPTRERLRGVLPQACDERDDGGRRDLLALSIKEARLPEHSEHTQTSRETCGNCAGRGAVAWAKGRATCDEFEMRFGKNKDSDTCGLVARRH